MQQVKSPIFERGRIYKMEMMEIMRDFPGDILTAYGETLSDGIVWGFTPQVDKDVISFSKGVTRYKGKFYVLHEPFQVAYSQTDVESAIRMEFGETQRTPDFTVTEVNVLWEENVQIKDNQQELARFKLKAGAYLRKNYQDLYDFTTEYNTINIVHVLYAGLGEPTLSSSILTYFAKEALNANPTNMLDMNFCLLCLNSSRMERRTIIHYLASRFHEPPANWSNKEIHDKLVHLLNKIKKEGGVLKSSSANGRKILVE